MGGQLLFRGAFDSVPDIHIRPLEQFKVLVPSNHSLILVDPAAPCGVLIDNPIKGFLAPAHRD